MKKDRLNELKETDAKLCADIELLQEKRRAINRQIYGEMEKMRLRDTDDLHVSDHALIRYIEREYKLDLDALRDEILSWQVRLGATVSRCGKFMVRPGLTAVVRDNVVVTTYEV